MKKLIPIITTILLVGCTHPKPGEVWVYEPKQPPWPECRFKESPSRVIEVKNGWVKYEKDGIEGCEFEQWFMINSHKVSNANH